MNLHPNPVKPLQHDEALIFIHLMKTGGSTLHKMLRRKYGDKYRFQYRNRPGRTLSDFQTMPAERRDSLKFIHGHIRYGIHTPLRQPYTYITMLRHPIERVISLYYFLYFHPSRYDPKTNPPVSFLEYFAEEPQEVDNGQTRRIAGELGRDCPFGQCPPELLDIAKENLRNHFSWVGITERFDESLVLLRPLLGLEESLYVRANSNPAKPKNKSLSEHELNLITQHNQLDLQLYAYANQLLDEAIIRYGDTFQSDLAFYKQANAQFSEAQADIEAVKVKIKATKLKLKEARQERNQIEKELNQRREALDQLMGGKFWKAWKLWQILKGRIRYPETP